MAWKTLEELKKIPITVERGGVNELSNLADEIDFISGISGGSFAAAAWPLFSENPDEFRKSFLEENIKRRLMMELFHPPWRFLRLVSPEYDRINIAAEYYDREIFKGATFSDLPERPVLRIHATDVALGMRFTFSDEDFDQVGSELATYPLGYAAAASSAFPVLLSPLTLLNHGETKSIEDLISSDRKYRRYVRNRRQDVLADLNRLGREHYNDKSNAYVHLADGGIVDNQGLGAILQEFATGGVINRRLTNNSHPLKRLVLINVNAGVKPESMLAKSPNSPRLYTVVTHTMVASMDILSAIRWMRIREFTQQLYKPVLDGLDIPSLSRLEKPYTIEISFRNIKDADLRAECNDIPTSFVLEKEELSLIDEVVPMLLSEDPDMERLRESLRSNNESARSF